MIDFTMVFNKEPKELQMYIIKYVSLIEDPNVLCDLENIEDVLEVLNGVLEDVRSVLLVLEKKKSKTFHEDFHDFFHVEDITYNESDSCESNVL